jgi:hypothetical protein
VKKDSATSNADSFENVTPAQVETTSDSVIHITFPEGGNEVTVEGKMQGINKRITVFIPAQKGQMLSAVLPPEDSTANVRISQIIYAGEKADGPFGRDLTKKIPTNGVCKLIIAENLMQDGDWKGKFKLTIKLQ